MIEVGKFHPQLRALAGELSKNPRVLITAPACADGDSVGAQLALRHMLLSGFPELKCSIINDEPLPPRYAFLPGVEYVDTPETAAAKGVSCKPGEFQVGFVVDGGIDRAGRLREVFHACPTRTFVDHHVVSAEYPYTIRFVEENASSTTELLFHLSQTPHFHAPVTAEFAQNIYLGLVFDTGFFRHPNTTPEAMELGAKLLRTGFDFPTVGERGMLSRSFSSLKMLADTLGRCRQNDEGTVIWSVLDSATMRKFHAIGDDREGIVDHMILTSGVEVAVLFLEVTPEETKISLRAHRNINVAEFARSLTVRGGGHVMAAGANLDMPIEKAVPWVLAALERFMNR